MRVLFIGGTGIISTACTDLAISRGVELTLLNRGHRISGIPAGVRSVTADIGDTAAVSRALAGESFDAVVDWIAFEPSHIERDLELFRGRTRQFIFISSASAYQKPVGHYLITESTPLANPFWTYSQQKIACEDRLMRAYREEGFPITIVRPSLTYGESQITLAINSWTRSYTVVDRMRRGRKVIVPGDGSSLWVITHNTDFAKGLVGLLGREQAIGHAFHITSDEVMTWDQWYRITAEAAGVEPQTRPYPERFPGRLHPRFARQPDWRQGRQRSVRQLQDQALRPRLLRHHAVHARHPPNHRLVRCRSGAPHDRRRSQHALGPADRRLGPRRRRGAPHLPRIGPAATDLGERASTPP